MDEKLNEKAIKAIVDSAGMIVAGLVISSIFLYYACYFWAGITVVIFVVAFFGKIQSDKKEKIDDEKRHRSNKLRNEAERERSEKQAKEHEDFIDGLSDEITLPETATKMSHDSLMDNENFWKVIELIDEAMGLGNNFVKVKDDMVIGDHNNGVVKALRKIRYTVETYANSNQSREVYERESQVFEDGRYKTEIHKTYGRPTITIDPIEKDEIYIYWDLEN